MNTLTKTCQLLLDYRNKNRGKFQYSYLSNKLNNLIHTKFEYIYFGNTFFGNIFLLSQTPRVKVNDEIVQDSETLRYLI